MKHKIYLIIVLVLIGIMPAMAFTVDPLTQVSGPSPFIPGCNGASQNGINYFNTVVEPWIAINPSNPDNIIGVWQQDRWSNGGANGLLAGVTHNGINWTRNMAHFSRCSGGNASNGGDYERASDPWVTFSPNGIAYQISLSFNDSNAANGVLVSRSTNGGDNWEEPITLIRDTTPNFFNDKESITADPTNSNVYAVWDRLIFINQMANHEAAENARTFAYRGPVMFSRTTDGQNWENAKVIFDPGQNAQTIGNQIVVLPNGDLVDVFDLYYSFKNSQDVRGDNVAIIRSTDKGVTWSRPIIISKPVIQGVYDPDTGTPVRTSDFLPAIAVDSNNGNLYVVWQDARFDATIPKTHIAFSMSTDGGLTWTDPVRIDKTPNGVFTFTPSIRVSSDTTVGITYYDFRNNNASPGLPTDYWIVHCSSNCTNSSNWQEDHIAGPFDMETAPISRGYFIGDYESLSNNGNKFLPFFVQTNGDKLDFTTNVFETTVG